MFKYAFLLLLTFPYTLGAQFLYGTTGFGLNLYQQFNGHYDYKIIGKSHNPSDRWLVYNPIPSTLLTSSSATLSMTPGQTIEGAYLIWSGVGDGANTSLTLNGNTIIPDSIQAVSIAVGSPEYRYKAIKDVTSYVQNFGSGNYQVANLPYQYNPNYAYNYYQGWNLVVVYSNPNLPTKQVNVYDGFLTCPATAIAFSFSNLLVTNTAAAKMSYIIYNGTAFWAPQPQCVKFNNFTLSNAQNPANNPFNSSHVGWPGTPNYQVDVDTYDISNYINVGDTGATFFSQSQFNIIYLSTLITSIQSELPDATISLDSITGQDICQNHDLTLDYTVYNVNALDTLMAGTPVSVFVNDSILISTVNLPSNINIGDSLSLSTLVTIPPGVSNPFNLSMVVNQNSTQLGVVYESNLTNNASNDTLIQLIEIIYPDFGTIGPICQGVNYSLPTTSLNGIDGTWSPAFNNQVGGTYFFMPDDTTCNQPVQLNVSIAGLSTPVFNIIDSICQGGNLVFPSVTQNGVHGTWSPLLNNQSSTAYTFTPDICTPALGCPTPVTHTVNIIPSTVPIFSLLDSICLNGQLTFPTVSDNSISGTWSPAFDNQNSANYTFTPDVSNPNNQNFSCLVSAQHSVVIVPPTTPNFSFVNSLCAGSTLTLPAVSDNGISGIWSVPFNNQATTNYTFIPDSTSILSSCAPSVTESITIIPTLSPSFNFLDSLCEDAVFNFPDVSIEGITGIWTPTFNNQATQNYTFTPSSLGIVNTSQGLRCPQVVNQIMTILANPIADFTPQYSVLPLYMPSTILENNSSNAYHFIWNFGDGTTNDSIFSPEHTFPEEAGSYLVSLQVSNQIGCMDTTSQVIVVEHDPVVFIPNAFTPDGDGLNNEFTAVFPENMKLASYEMFIYDRWGELVFYSQDPKQGWDASLAGFDAPDGVYSYLVKYKEFGYVNKFQVTGSVVVIR
jgi:gliding motility-associated-like protein